MDSDWVRNTSILTPLYSNKRCTKLSLKKTINSCPSKQQTKYKHNDDVVENKTENISIKRTSLIFHNNDDFNTPPFVTTSRPKYKKQSNSTPNLSIDFIENTLNNTSLIHAHSDTFIHNKTSQFDEFNIMEPINDRLNVSGVTSQDNNGICIHKNCSDMFDDVNQTPRNVYHPLSPKSAKIMTSMYGDVWRKTPGLFKKSERQESKFLSKAYNNYKLDDFNISSLDIEDSDNHDNNLNDSDDYLLKPKMLSFENELNSLEKRKSSGVRSLKQNTENNYDSDSDDLIFSVKKNIRNRIISSSSSNNSDDELFKNDFIDNVPDFEYPENELYENRRSHIRIETNLECSVVLVETDGEAGPDKDKKTRKLFTKHKNVFEDVEFVSEQLPDEFTVRNRVFEIIDDNIEQIGRDFEKNLKINDVAKDLSNVDDFISKIDSVEKPVKKVKRKPRERKKDKENILPTVTQTQNINLDNLEIYGFMASLSDSVPSWRCDKEAKHYKDKFKSKKCELTQKLFVLYNENVYSGQLDANLPITWSSSLITTAGRAYNKIKKYHTRSSSVELSIKVVDSAQRLRDTLAHELCHVAAWLIDGQLRDGHGPYWKKWVAKTLQVYPELGSIPVCHSLDIYYKFTFKCIRCGYGVNRHSKSIDVTKKACGYCGGRFECIHNKKNKDGVVVSTPVKRASRELKGFALYVKENYGNVRGSNTPHKQAMQYLGRQYAKMRAAQGSSTESNK